MISGYCIETKQFPWQQVARDEFVSLGIVNDGFGRSSLNREYASEFIAFAKKMLASLQGFLTGDDAADAFDILSG